MIVYVKLFLTALFWGGTFIAGRVVAQSAGPFSAAFIRFVLASVFLLMLTRKYEGPLPRPRPDQWLKLAVLGASGVIAYNAFFFSGLKYLHAGRGAVIVATNPIFISLFAAYFFQERLTPLKGVGILTSVTGAILVISRGNPEILLHGGLGVGELLIFGCVVSWVVYSLMGKVTMKELPPFATVTYACMIGSVGLLFLALAEGIVGEVAHYPGSVWIGLFYLAFFGSSLGLSWYYQGIRSIGPSRASVFINFVPVSAVFLAFLILREPLTWSLIVGTLLVSGGVYLTNLAGLRAAARAAQTSKA